MQKNKIKFKAKNNENTVEMSRFSSHQRINCKYVGATSGRPIFEETTKNSNGITLVALIITIIVMLILLGVSVTVALNGGIFNQAKKAQNQTIIEEEKEHLQLAMINMELENENDIFKRKEIFKKYLDDVVGEENTKVYVSGNGYTVHFLLTNHIYTIEENKNIKEEDDSILVQDQTLGIFDGEGTEESPYVIMSIEDLIEWSKNYNSYISNYIKLGKTLDFKSELSYCNYQTNIYNDFFSINDEQVTIFEILTNKNYLGFIPIASFNGVFDGQNYKIINFYMNNSLLSMGLFANTQSNSLIKNLNISGEILQYSTDRNCRVGAIVGKGSGRIESCTNTCNIKKTNSNMCGCGGISGYYDGIIYNCINNGIIESSGLAGGITGTGSATIINCYNTGDITVTGGWSASGINGGDYCSYKSNIYNCYNTGNITTKEHSIYSTSGGIYGYMANNIGSLNIVNCWNTGTLSSWWSRGGIIGIIRKITPNVLNCSYIETGPDQSSIAKPYSQSYMQSKDFINELNNYIESNEEGIDTTGWAKWIQVEGGYPTLDFNTIWDGEKWIPMQ